METILVTGFPGFLCSELLPRLLSTRPDARAICVVQPRYSALAIDRVAAMGRSDPALMRRIDLRSGDITQPGLGIAASDELRREITAIFHLAAIYDLGVERSAGMRVNVEGTRNVLDFAATCGSLQRLHHVSTCFVSGRHRGLFREADLDVGQTFNNFYEETKYLAEVEVRRRMHAGMPVTIYRPAIVVGDSTTGATQKFDGPYFAIQWLLRQPRIAVMPVVGDPTATDFNVVPRDFVVSAMVHLMSRADSVGQTFHLADPEPLTVDGILTVLASATKRRVVRVPLPLVGAKWAIEHVPGVYRLLRIPAGAIDYFVHPTRYDTMATVAALADSDISCPRFASYAARLVSFAAIHPEIGAHAMA